MAKHPSSELSINVTIKSLEFRMPPVRDGLLLGKDSPIGCEAMRRALKILQPTSFDHIELGPKDDVLSDILVRSSILRKIPRNKLVEIVLRRFKPMMDSRECLEFEVATEMISEDQI